MTDSMSRPRVGCSSSMTLGARATRASSARCWLPPESDSTGLAGVPLMLNSRDALLGQPAPALPVDEEARLLLGEEEVLGEGEAGDEALLETGGGHVGHAPALEVVVGPAGQVDVVEHAMRPPVVGASPAQARRKTLWPLPSMPASPMVSPARTSQVDRVELDAPLLRAHARQLWKRRLPGRTHPALAGGHLPLEHHGDQAVHAGTGASASPMSRPCRSTATRVQSSWTSSSLCDTKRTVLPWAASRRSVSKSWSRCVALMPVVGSSRMSTRAPSHSRRSSSSCWRSPTVSEPTSALRSMVEPQRAGQLGDGLGGGLRAAGEEPAGCADEQVVHHAHGGEVQRVLVQHAHAVPDGVGGRAAW